MTMTLNNSWPRVRVGNRVRLRRRELVAEVVVVRRARDVLRELTEEKALMLGPKCQALYGANWIEVYYEAEARIESTGALITITPNDVEAVL